MCLLVIWYICSQGKSEWKVGTRLNCLAMVWELKKVGEHCLDQITHESRIGVGGSNKPNHQLIPCSVVKVFSCSTKIKWAHGWTSCLSCSRYFLLLFSYTMIIIYFAKQQVVSSKEKGKIAKWYSRKLWHKNKVWFSCPTYNGYFDSNGRGWFLELIGMCHQP
jgi:hypothetical protein